MRKKRQFVGGILQDARGGILMVGRSSSDEDMAGLWSLPAGELEEGESDEQGLKREFEEETGIMVTVGEKIDTVSREAWEVSIYEVRMIGGELSLGLDPDIVRLEYFPFSGLPEKIVLEARISIYRFFSRGSAASNISSKHLEGFFSSIYYSYLDKNLNDLDGPRTSLLSFIVRNTKFRKFKSIIPYLLSGADMKVKKGCLYPEFQFAIWTLLDNLCDQRFEKYDIPTALKIKGIPACSIGLFRVMKDLEYLAESDVPWLANTIQEGLMICAEGQALRFQNQLGVSLESYLNGAYMRSQFLGITWEKILRTHGYPEEADLIALLYPISSKTGQLLNDFYDMREEINDYEDFDDKVVNAHLILLSEKMGDRSNELREIWNSEEGDDGKRAYKELVEKYDIRNDLLGIIRKNVTSMIHLIAEASIAKEKKTILRYWIEMQFSKHIQNEPKYSLLELSDAIDFLCKNIK